MNSDAPFPTQDTSTQNLDDLPAPSDRDLGVVVTGSRQVAHEWAALSARTLCEGTKESAVGDADALRHALNGAVAVIRDLANVAEGAGIKPALGWGCEALVARRAACGMGGLSDGVGGDPHPTGQLRDEP